MFFPAAVRRLLIVLVFSITAAAAGIAAQDNKWRPIGAAEISGTRPTVEADADAEALLWEVRIDDSDPSELALQHYVRIKIFTERGREKHSKLDVPFTKGLKIKDLAARVIKADGSIVEVKKEEIFEREIIRASGIKVKAKSFAVPNIEPGVIVEYRYKEVFNDASARGMRLHFQRDIPIQRIAYYYKPWSKTEPLYQSYNFTDTKFAKDKDGYWLAVRSNVPAFKEEAYMPPEDMVKAWMQLQANRIAPAAIQGFSVVYSLKTPGIPSIYWGAVSLENAAWTNLMTKKSDEIKKAATEITAGAATPEEKLRKIYAFVQTEIANTSYDTSLTDEMRRKLPPMKSVSDVLKRKSGSIHHVDLLFGALAHAAGFETRVGLISDRSQIFFNTEMTNENFLGLGVIGVKVGDNWQLFNPGSKFLPYGMLAWYEEKAPALLVSDKRYDWREAPQTSHEKSNSKRTGKFTLAEDGTLEGDVSIELTGHLALTYRKENYDEAAAKREENVKKEVADRASTAELSAIAVENVEDASKPVTIRYKVRVPGYAQKTGKRLFLQPGYFEYGVTSPFTSSTRLYDVYFRHPWSESDQVEITYPAGFALESEDSPAPMADPNNIGSLKIKIFLDKPNNKMTYAREFFFGGGGHVLFPKDAYPALKQLFDGFSRADAHTLTLRQK